VTKHDYAELERKLCRKAAISSKTPCNMVQNAPQFASKRKPFCRKTQCILPQNARLNAAKRKAKSIKMHRKLGIMRFHFD
jgi:hypothetical protein